MRSPTIGRELVVDLSDEPVLGPRERFAMASRVLAHGLPYVGADFRFDPPELEPFELPSIGIVGTGKRVGKTAITAHAAQLFSRDRKVVVVSMGRGGPPEPEVANVPPTVEALLELSDAGRHAASDYLETAALAGVTTVGCRRCGGGLAGAVFAANVHEGARKAAATLEPDLVVFDGSGAALPPVETRRRILVVNAQQDPDVVTGYLNGYRHLISDLVVLTMAEEGSGWERLRDRAAELGPRVVATTLHPRPAESVAGRRVAFFSAAPESAHAGFASHLADEHGAEVTHVSGSLVQPRHAARGARDRGRGRLPRRAEGRCHRRRRRGRARAWGGGRAGGKRCPPGARRAGSRRGAPPPRLGGG